MIPDQFFNEDGELVEDSAFFAWCRSQGVTGILEASNARDATGAVKGRAHDHHGPNPCPVCGGKK